MTRRVRRTWVVALWIVLPAGADAQEKPSQAEMKRLQRIMLEATAPGVEHERLAQLVGRWDQEEELWPEPGGQPMMLTGTV